MLEFKKCKVIMLPTGDITGIVLHPTGLDKIVHTKESELKAVLDIGGVSQHLYITSDEKIEEGDWMLNLSGVKYNEQIISKCSKNAAVNWKDNMLINGGTKSIRDCIKKIVATTDKSLMYTSNNGRVGYNLPQIPQSFIKQYCEVGGIDEIDMFNENIETDSGDYIIIKPIKESWTREEVEELCRTALHTRFPGNMCMQEDEDKWIANNIK